MMSLLELAARVEGLAGPDRDVDGDIALLLNLNPSWAHIQYERQKSLFGDGGAGLRAKTWLAPKFTASLDAAMTLADPSWWLSMSGPMSPAAYGYSREDNRFCRAGFEMIGAPYSVGTRTPAGEGDTVGRFARMITAAGLRARASTC